MTKKEAIQEFKELYPRDTFVNPYGFIDKVARNEAWNNFTDYLCKEGRITLKQYETWTHPWS